MVLHVPVPIGVTYTLLLCNLKLSFIVHCSLNHMSNTSNVLLLEAGKMLYGGQAVCKANVVEES